MVEIVDAEPGGAIDRTLLDKGLLPGCSLASSSPSRPLKGSW
ncbi:hypothetical protein AHiyo8_pI68180 (plasmid) [Arthrobacter sp. Hiyo8]|nr:hypothetical protein AHiyo8_pI68180 [Arthrobacter sp. Hiyo8]